MINTQNLIELISQCKKIKTKKYKKGELITTYIANRTQVGIILEGSVNLIRYDMDGNRNIIERFDQGNIYGEIFHLKENVNGLIVEAASTTIIARIDYDNIINPCKDNCPVHNKINAELSNMIIEKIKSVNTRIELLTKRSTREKILAYFSLISKGRINKTFKVPFSYTDLADYLNVDRSAMTREIASLVEDGIIEKEGKYIKILY